jgi:hypothetical protein
VRYGYSSFFSIKNTFISASQPSPEQDSPVPYQTHFLRSEFRDESGVRVTGISAREGCTLIMRMITGGIINGEGAPGTGEKGRSVFFVPSSTPIIADSFLDEAR